MKCPYRGEEMMRGYMMSSQTLLLQLIIRQKFFIQKNRTIWN